MGGELADYLLRLAIALPLVLAVAVASIVALQRGWLRWPAGGFSILTSRCGRGLPLPAAKALELVSVQTLGPAARIAVLRFAGRDHLVGVTGSTISVLASAPAAVPSADPSERRAA